jgi:hypothetical protein
MADTGVVIDLNRGVGQTRESLGELLRFYSGGVA